MEIFQHHWWHRRKYPEYLCVYTWYCVIIEQLVGVWIRWEYWGGGWNNMCHVELHQYIQLLCLVLPQLHCSYIPPIKQGQYCVITGGIDNWILFWNRKIHIFFPITILGWFRIYPNCNSFWIWYSIEFLHMSYYQP